MSQQDKNFFYIANYTCNVLTLYSNNIFNNNIANNIFQIHRFKRMNQSIGTK